MSMYRITGSFCGAPAWVTLEDGQVDASTDTLGEVVRAEAGDDFGPPLPNAGGDDLADPLVWANAACRAMEDVDMADLPPKWFDVDEGAVA